MNGKWPRLLAVLAALVAAAALLGLDVILLDTPAGNEAVGKLGVQANAAAASIPGNNTTANVRTVPSTAGHIDDRGEDD